MKILLLGATALVLLGSPWHQDSKLSDPITLDVEVGSIRHAVEELSHASRIPMKVAESAANDTVFIHVDNQPIQDVMDHLASAVQGEWKLNQDHSYTLSRSFKSFEDDQSQQYQKHLGALEAWRSNLRKSLDSPFESSDLAKIMTEYRAITTHDKDKDFDQSKEDAATSKRRDSLEQMNPMARAAARSIALIDFRQVAALNRGDELRFTDGANRSQIQLPAGYGTAMTKLPSEMNRWTAELAKHPAKKTDEEIEDEKNAEAVSYGEETKAEIEKRKEQDLEYLCEKDPWLRTEPLPSLPAHALIIFGRDRDEQFTCRLTMFDENGRAVAKYFASVGDFHGYEEKKPVNADAIPSAATQAIWQFYKSSENSEQVTISPETYRTVEPYFNDPLGNDFLKLGNQELLTTIAKTKGKSVIACLSDDAFMGYQETFSTSTLMGEDPNGDFKHKESKDWIEIFPADYLNHWHHRMNRKAMSDFSQQYRSKQKVDLKTTVQLECGEFGFGTGFSMPRFLENMDPHNNWNRAASETPFNHLYLSLTDQQWARIEAGKIIPYRELSESQLYLVSQIVYRNMDFGYVGGTAPNKLAQSDPSYELPNGLIDGFGLGGEIVADDICMTHNPSEKPLNLDTNSWGLNISERKETFHRFGGCGNRVCIPQKSIFEFRKQRRVSLHVYLSAKHYIVGDFIEATQKYSGGKLYRYEELSPEMIKRISAREMIIDDSDRQSEPPPLK